MFEDIKKIWKLCFGDTDTIIDSFIENYKDEALLLTEQKDEVVVSFLFLIPAFFPVNKKKEKIYYLYAAATHPDFQKQGYMSRLLEKAKQTAKKNNVNYIALVPSNEQLFNYYSKFGYQTFFSINSVRITREEMNIFSSLDRAENNENSYDECNKIRNKFLKLGNSSVEWSDKFFTLATKFNEVCGGKIITVNCGDESGYAIYREYEGIAEITELICSKKLLPYIVNELLYCTSSKKYLFRFPTYLDLFNDLPRKKNFGMLLPVNSKNLPKNSSGAYIGMVKD